MLYDLLGKSRPEFTAAVRRPYDLYGSINAACYLDLRAAVRSEQVQQSRPYQIRTVRIVSLLLICLEIRALLCFGIRASFLLQTLLQKKNRNFSSLALSQSLNLSKKE
jgi:hypothetical protein